MRLYIAFLVVFLFDIIVIKAQIPEENVVTDDTIIENIVYEYDTIYLAPDTIKLVDTVVNYLPAKKKIKTHSWSIGVSFLPFFSSASNGKNVVDSFSLKQKLNYGVNFNLGYTKKDFIYGLGVGLTPIREQLVLQHINYEALQNTGGVYDSIQVNNNCTANNYFNYLNFNLLVGKKWSKGNFLYTINAHFLTDMLISYSAYMPINNSENKIPASMIKDLGLGLALNPNIGYRIGKNLELNVSLLYRYALNKQNKYPQSNLHYMDIAFGAGLNLIL